jgi:hypothetical protein
MNIKNAKQAIEDFEKNIIETIEETEKSLVILKLDIAKDMDGLMASESCGCKETLKELLDLKIKRMVIDIDYLNNLKRILG